MLHPPHPPFFVPSPSRLHNPVNTSRGLAVIKNQYVRYKLRPCVVKPKYTSQKGYVALQLLLLMPAILPHQQIDYIPISANHILRIESYLRSTKLNMSQIVSGRQ